MAMQKCWCICFPDGTRDMSQAPFKFKSIADRIIAEEELERIVLEKEVDVLSLPTTVHVDMGSMPEDLEDSFDHMIEDGSPFSSDF